MDYMIAEDGSRVIENVDWAMGATFCIWLLFIVGLSTQSPSPPATPPFTSPSAIFRRITGSHIEIAQPVTGIHL